MSWLSFRCPDGFEMRAFLVRPDGDGPFPGVLFVGEPFGIEDEMQRVVLEIAAGGYAVLAPDLRQRGSFFTCVRRLMVDLSRGEGRGIDDLLAGRQALADLECVDPDRIAVVGLCMGGGFALVLARTGLFRVAAPFYGQVPERMEGSCPVVASYGARDRPLVPHATRLRGELQRLGVPHDIQVYPEAGHSFLTRPPNLAMAAVGNLFGAGLHPESASDAMRRLFIFFDAHL